MTRTHLIGVAGVLVVVAIALYLIFGADTGPSEEGQNPAPQNGEAVTQTGQTAAEDTEDSGATDEAPAPEAVAETDESENQPSVSENVETPAAVTTPPPPPSPPEFDVVRVARDGNAVIAGRAPPESRVQILDGEAVIGSMVADRRGEWVLVPDTPLTPGPHELTLTAVTADGVSLESDKSVMLLVPERGKDIAGRDLAPAGDGDGEALALLVPKSGSDGETTVLQKPSGGRGEAEQGSLIVDAVEYAQDGKTTLIGRATPGREIRAYLDNRLTGRTVTGLDGTWRIAADRPLAAGAHDLRLDGVDAEGRVVTRIEVPLTRPAATPGEGERSFVIVQPGNSLWRIARRIMGSGIRYSVIYEANRDQIRDPDLIYPGQVFTVPAD